MRVPVWPARTASRTTRYWLPLPLGEGWGEGASFGLLAQPWRVTRYWLPHPRGEGWGEGSVCSRREPRHPVWAVFQSQPDTNLSKMISHPNLFPSV